MSTTATGTTALSALPHERLCIHQVCLMQCDFHTAMECLARHGVTMTVPWIDKLEEIGAKEAARILDGNGVDAISIAAGGHLTGSCIAKTLERNKRWLEHAQIIGARSMVTLTGGMMPGDTDIAAARAQAVEGLAQLVPLARDAGVRLALEPLHPMVCSFRSVISTLSEAIAILDQIDAPDVMGIAFDSYALWWDADLQSEIRRAGERICNVHMSDWLHETKDVRLDRGMPGDGHIDNPAIRRWLETAGFTGPIEIEIFSANDWWTRDPSEMVATIVERAARYL